MRKLILIFIFSCSFCSFALESVSQTAYTLPKRLFQTSLFTTSYGVTDDFMVSAKTLDMIFGTFDVSLKYAFKNVFNGLTLSPEFRFVHGRGGPSFPLNGWASYRFSLAPVSELWT